MSNAQLAMIADLLAAVGDMLAAWAERRRGGPGKMRRALSVVLTLFALAIARFWRRDIAAITRQCRNAVRYLTRHMAQPPAGWSAP